MVFKFEFIFTHVNVVWKILDTDKSSRVSSVNSAFVGITIQASLAMMWQLLPLKEVRGALDTKEL